MPIYVGNHKIADTGTHGIYVGSRAINAVYVGSRKVYQYLPSGQTFQASDSFQTYTVPKGCTKLSIDCVASKGNNGNATGGKGGRVQCTLTVTPLQTLYIMVGKIPTEARGASYNAADIRTNNAGITDNTSLQSRLVVAGGGGSGGIGSSSNGNGGNGGGTTGAQGAGANGCVGGMGGTQSSGGAHGYGTAAVAYDGQDGKFGLGGNGAGGGGGAGWYGGGGGGGHSYFSGDEAGGGGGSSYTNSTYCSNVTHTQGYQAGAGYITITPIH